MDPFFLSQGDGTILVQDNYSSGPSEDQGQQLFVEVADSKVDRGSLGLLDSIETRYAAVERSEVKRLRDWLNDWLERD